MNSDNDECVIIDYIKSNFDIDLFTESLSIYDDICGNGLYVKILRFEEPLHLDIPLKYEWMSQCNEYFKRLINIHKYESKKCNCKSCKYPNEFWPTFDK